MFCCLDEDIPYVQYPSKQQQQQQIHVDEPIPSGIVTASAPTIVKLPSDEPLPTTSIVASHPQPLVTCTPLSLSLDRLFVAYFRSSSVSPLPVPVLPPPASLPTFNDSFDFFNTLMMSNGLIGDLDWLNIESEESIRPRKRQNIITISRTFATVFTGSSRWISSSRWHGESLDSRGRKSQRLCSNRLSKQSCSTRTCEIPTEITQLQTR